MTILRLHQSASLALALGCSIVAAQPVNTLKKITDAGAITMGVRDASGAMSYSLGANDYAGFHVDVCRQVVADLQKQLNLKKLEIRYQLVTAQNRIPLVQNGTVDIECGTTTNNTSRQRDVAFAPTLYVEEVRVATKKKSGIQSLAQLANRTVAATAGSTAVQLIRKHERASGVEFKELFGKDNSDGFLLLETDRADAFAADGQILATMISQAKQPDQYVVLGDVLNVEPIAIMLPKGDAAFKRAVDASVMKLAKSGEVAKLYDKWFVQPIPPNNVRVNLPATERTKAAWVELTDKPLEDYAKK
ncbi:MAG: Periplasmic component of amino acid ABC-type transporter/signal transduction system [Rhodoferax sp.]|nr:Periplasmic component of amino acid ABC-type transporter/signal transduction system [Rhodoferax sp.]